MRTMTKTAVDLGTGDLIVDHAGETWEVQCVETGDGETLPVTVCPEFGPEETLPFGVEAEVTIAL